MRNTQRKPLKLQLFYFILLVLGLRFVFVYVMKHLEVWYTSENICAKAKCCFAAVVYSFSDSIDMSVNHTLARTAALSRAARGPHNGAAQERGRQKTPILPETEPGSPPCARAALYWVRGYLSCILLAFKRSLTNGLTRTKGCSLFFSLKAEKP